MILKLWAYVALRKESVDRNSLDAKADSVTQWSLSARRAWIEIGVLQCNTVIDGSLSARRAWIEIVLFYSPLHIKKVALRKESVDRNVVMRCCAKCANTVALRKESVDRN